MRFLGLGSGKDGVIALGSYTPLAYSCSGTSGAFSLSATGSFSAGDRLFIIQSRGTGVGVYEDNRVASYSTGTITLVHPLENTYTDSGASQAQVLIVKEASSVTGSLTVSAWDGNVGGVFAIACNGTFSGTINATGKGYLGATGGNSTDSTGRQGEGTSGATGTVSINANGNGGGGGENGLNDRCGGGGGGGYASAGTNGNTIESIPEYSRGGTGGSTVGQADLSTGLFFGGGGGEGGNGDQGTSGGGGAGGGIIVVYAKSFSNTASLIVNGNNGSNSSNPYAGGGGAGAGGTVLIKSVSANIGTSTISSTGGTGGIGTGSPGTPGPGSGGAGSVGRIRVESCSLSGTTNPSASTQTGGFSYCGTNIAIL